MLLMEIEGHVLVTVWEENQDDDIDYLHITAQCIRVATNHSPMQYRVAIHITAQCITE